MTLKDTLSRPLRNLRISVTDRCNLRCAYCMPEEDYCWLPRPNILRFEEIALLVRAFTAVGVDRIRLTGGEPLLRRDLPELITLLAQNEELHDIAITTNGVVLAEQASALIKAGMQRFTVSLDSLRPERFKALTRSDALDKVLAGIETVTGLVGPLAGTKIDTVVIRGTNDDELVDLVEYAKRVGAELRFIEYMDVGGATQWTVERVVPRKEMLQRLAAHYGGIEALDEDNAAPADRYRLPDGTLIGIISSTTEPFCSSCNRSRLTADGMWYLCLYAQAGHDLRRLVREGAEEEEIVAVLEGIWGARDDRGAEVRLESADRSALLGASALRGAPHLEMHTRGG